MTSGMSVLGKETKAEDVEAAAEAGSSISGEGNSSMAGAVSWRLRANRLGVEYFRLVEDRGCPVDKVNTLAYSFNLEHKLLLSSE